MKGKLATPGTGGKHAETAWSAERFGHLETVEMVFDNLRVTCSSIATAMPKSSGLRMVADNRAANQPVE